MSVMLGIYYNPDWPNVFQKRQNPAKQVDNDRRKLDTAENEGL